MNLLSWMMLAFLLSAGTSVDTVDVNKLTDTVKRIREKYKIGGQFCLAANIPLNGQDVDLPSRESVMNKLNANQVYKDSTVVIAKVVKPEHAELRVLRNLSTLIDKSRDNFLLIYSYLSPCGTTCINQDSKHNILTNITGTVLKHWSDVAFVFEVVFDKPKNQRNRGSRPEIIPKEELIKTLTDLGATGIGLQNIFRCYKANSEFQCHSCSYQGKVSNVCVDNNAEPGQEEGRDIDIRRDRYRSRSRDRGVKRDRSRSRDRKKQRQKWKQRKT
ncbi:hypothetical protein Q5P01_002840 [Channa striata]|uniref:Uncharacterized protein n=1 Tax=Channa striata TaxID=64152 RepID=A0AA88NR65_CHASR|nr:hypothetical protein Q5P01_002840 [Channa striata]